MKKYTSDYFERKYKILFELLKKYMTKNCKSIMTEYKY